MAKKRAAEDSPPKTRLSIEYRRLDELIPWEGNPKEHALVELEESVQRFGFTDPITLNEANGRIIGGHGRLEALRERKASGQPPPERVEVDTDGEWIVPVVMGIALDEVEHEALGLAENQITMAGRWDESKLQAALSHIEAAEGLTGTGFSSADVDPGAIVAAGGEEDPDVAAVPGMDLQPFEHWDYIVLMFRDARDYVRAGTLFDLKSVNFKELAGKKKMGLGRVVDGTRLFTLLEKKQ